MFTLGTFTLVLLRFFSGVFEAYDKIGIISLGRNTFAVVFTYFTFFFSSPLSFFYMLSKMRFFNFGMRGLEFVVFCLFCVTSIFNSCETSASSRVPSS